MSYFGPVGNKRYRTLESGSLTLDVRQHPKLALVTAENKEKARKPVDPPPIVQLKIQPEHDTTHGHWLVNPFLFMSVVLVEANPSADGTYKPIPQNPLLGQTVSSLHRLKDIDNNDGGFFVFGDISCRKQGTYRLMFSLFDYNKDTAEVVYEKSAYSDPFQVVTTKDFRGMQESTHLSRSFSDQGVRLRLRKEPRTVSGGKRAYDSSPPITSPAPAYNSMYGGPVQDYQYGGGYSTQSMKRQRSDSDYNNAHLYSQAPLPAGAISQYGTHIPGNEHTWAVQHPSALQTDQNTMSGLMPQSRGMPVSVSGWQRGPYQQEVMSAPATGSDRMQYFGAPHAPSQSSRGYFSNAYNQQQAQGYSARGSGDAQPSVAGLHTPTSISDHGYTTQQSQSYLPSVPEVGSQSASMGMVQPQTQTAQGLQSAYGQYGTRQAQVDASLAGYPSTTHAGAHYGQQPQATVASYDQSAYSTAQNLYSDPTRDSYPPHTSTLSTSSLPLDAGVLNRGYPGAYQQAAYGALPEQDITGFEKADSQPYPTPQQTSPT